MSASFVCPHSQAPLWEHEKNNVINWEASNCCWYPLLGNPVDVSFTHLAGPCLCCCDQAERCCHRWPWQGCFSPCSLQNYTPEGKRMSAGLVVCHTQQQSYNSMSIKAISFKCTRRPDGLRSLLSRGLQRALGKVFKSSFVFFTAEREIVSLSLKGHKQGESAMQDCVGWKVDYLRAKAMMELGSLSHTAMGTRSWSYMR